MTKVRANIWIWAALTLAVLSSCCDRDDRMLSTVTLYPTISNNVETEVSTRASVTVSGTAQGTTYETDPAVTGVPTGTTLMVFAVPTGGIEDQIKANRITGLFRYSNGKWNSYVTATDQKPYNLYAVSPNDIVNPQDFNWGLSDPNDNTTFLTDNVALTFHDLDVIVDYDPMISIAAAGRYVYKNNSVDYEVTSAEPTSTATVLTHPALTKNTYSIGTVYQPAQSDPNHQYRVWLAMNHLYAKATVSFAVYDKYDEIRTIHLNQAKLVIDKNKRSLSGDHTYNFDNSSFDYDLNPSFGTNRSNDTDIEVDLIRGATAKNNRDIGHEYVTLTPPGNNDAGYKDFAWFCFLPQSILPYENGAYTLTCPACTLTVNYDVLDKNGNMVREGQTAHNIIPLNQFYRDDNIEHTPKPGEHIKIKILVKPSYLYKLTDDDAKMELEIQ